MTMDLRYLILSLTTRCNLQCVYCYHGAATEPLDMSETVVAHALDLAQSGTGNFHLQLTGGEPTLVPELLEYVVRQARGLHRPCTIGIQTNGTALTKELVRLFQTYQVQVGVSLDGPPAIHQKVRGGMAETLRGLSLLEKCGVPFRVTAVVAEHNCLTLDRLVLLLGNYRLSRGIGLDLLTCKGRAVQRVQPAPRDDLRRGLIAMVKALEAVNHHRSWPLEFRELDKVRSRMSGSSRPFCHACLGQSVAVHPDGRIFPCGQTLADDRFAAGTVWLPEADKLRITQRIVAGGEHCDACPFLGNCPGDCPSRLYYNGENEATRDLFCHMYRSLWQTVAVRHPSWPDQHVVITSKQRDKITKHSF